MASALNYDPENQEKRRRKKGRVIKRSPMVSEITNISQNIKIMHYNQKMVKPELKDSKLNPAGNGKAFSPTG